MRNNLPLWGGVVQRGLTDVQRNHAVGRVGQRGFELQGRLLQAQDVAEDVLVEASDQVKLAGIEEETRLLQLDGDGHFTGASVNWEMRNLQTEATDQKSAVSPRRLPSSPFLRQEARTRGMGLAVRMPKHLVVSSGGYSLRLRKLSSSGSGVVRTIPITYR